MQKLKGKREKVKPKTAGKGSIVRGEGGFQERDISEERGTARGSKRKGDSPSGSGLAQKKGVFGLKVSLRSMKPTESEPRWEGLRKKEEGLEKGGRGPNRLRGGGG